MNAPGRVLYTQDILALAVSLADWPMREGFAHEAELRSQSCGSVVRVGIDLDDTGAVSGFGIDARACALGQASAAVLAAHILGRSAVALVEARDGVTRYFAGQDREFGTLADKWPGIEHLASALPYPARHGSILLAWRAAVAAIESSRAGGQS